MAKQKLDKEIKKKLLHCRSLVEGIAKADSNEAETRSRVDYLFEAVMGYDRFKHITQEYGIHTAGDTVHCDIAIQLDREKSKPDLLVEVKKVGIDLSSKHIRQAASYGIEKGCEWILLTNSREWKLYHISFTQPPQTKLVDFWNIINDDPVKLAGKFELVSYKNIKKGGLARLWEKSNVLTAQNLLKIILSEDSIISIRRGLKKSTDVTVSPEEIVGAVRHLLNEGALAEMEKIKISLPEKKQTKRKVTSKSKAEKEEPPVEEPIVEES